MNPNQPSPLDRYYRLPETEQFTGLKKSSIYAGVKNSSFPAPVRLSRRAVAWKESDLVRWQASRKSTQEA